MGENINFLTHTKYFFIFAHHCIHFFATKILSFFNIAKK